MDPFAQAFEILVVSLTSLSFVALGAFVVSDAVADRRAARARTARATQPRKQQFQVSEVVEYPAAA